MKILWLKLEADIFDNAKIKKIRRLAGGNDYFVLWIGILTLGMKSKRYGILEISDGMPYTHDDLAEEFGLTPETVGQGLDVFERMGMISRTDGNTIEIVNFRKYQNVERIEQVRELARIRQAKRRQKQIEYHEEKLKISSDHDINNKAEAEAEAEAEEVARTKSVSNANVTRDNKFQKPTPEEVKAYATELSFHALIRQPLAFIDYYEAKGWRVGSAHMKDWRAAVRTWHRNDKSNPASSRSQVITGAAGRRIPQGADHIYKDPLADQQKIAEELERRQAAGEAK